MDDNLGTISLCYAVRYERTSRHSADRLWKAISRAEEVSAWMDYPASIDLQLGGAYFVDFSKASEGEIAGVICRLEPGRVLGYVWGWSVCEWTIEADGDGCRYTFIQNGLADRGEGEEGLIAGWHGFFDQLDEYLDAIPLDLARHRATWNERKAPYRSLLRAKLPAADEAGS
ncbi:hypothetical protein AYO38_06405 [bacterium SCGC AG-212-C10]|nr:hypothetical protein AYO38_06405 [bacterium SCGC AG-212-C10]